MKIAIIGGIGSGKSQVLSVAKKMGVATLSADEINAQLLTCKDYISKIEKAFLGVVEDGVVNKQKLSKIVFSSESERQKLNAIAHPQIVKHIRECKKAPLVVELPLILECGLQDYFDEIVHVDTPLELRLSRLKEGRGIDEDRAKAIIATQPSESELERVATYTLKNDKSLAKLQADAKELLENLLSKK